jgi:hypothetical protein
VVDLNDVDAEDFVVNVVSAPKEVKEARIAEVASAVVVVVAVVVVIAAESVTMTPRVGSLAPSSDASSARERSSPSRRSTFTLSPSRSTKLLITSLEPSSRMRS